LGTKPNDQKIKERDQIEDNKGNSRAKEADEYIL
jgi:hypothetical protein